VALRINTVPSHTLDMIHKVMDAVMVLASLGNDVMVNYMRTRKHQYRYRNKLYINVLFTPPEKGGGGVGGEIQNFLTCIRFFTLFINKNVLFRYCRHQNLTILKFNKSYNSLVTSKMTCLLAAISYILKDIFFGNFNAKWSQAPALQRGPITLRSFKSDT